MKIMKKLLSLALALMLACTTLPALAEGGLSNLFSGLTSNTTQEEAFPYTQADYKLYLDLLAYVMLEVSPTWSAEGNNHAAVVGDYGVVNVSTNADGYVTRISINVDVSATNMAAAENLGLLTALAALASKTTEDTSFLEQHAGAFSDELVNILYGLMGRIAEAMEGPVSSSGEIYGDTATFTMSLDLTTMVIHFQFVYEP